jgi:hypothetical protein
MRQGNPLHGIFTLSLPQVHLRIPLNTNIDQPGGHTYGTASINTVVSCEWLACMLHVGVAIFQPRSDDIKVCGSPRFRELDKSGLKITRSWHIHCWIANDGERELVVMLQFQESGSTIEPYGLHPLATGILANMPEQFAHVTPSSNSVLVKLAKIVGYVESWAKSSTKLFTPIAQLCGTVKLIGLELSILTQTR